MRFCAALSVLGLVSMGYSAPAWPCTHSRRDGGAAPDLSQSAQQALIIHRSGYQTMALGMDYRADGPLSGLAWIIPVPNMPDEVGTGAPSLFKDLEGWVSPAWNAARSAGGSSINAGALKVHPAISAGPYRIQPLESRGTAAATELNEWLVLEGFEAIPEGHLQYYIDRSWTFLAVELESKGGLRKKGGMEPLVLSFPSRTAVFPLKLSTNAGSFPVRIYLVTDDPVDESEFSDVREKGFMVAGSQDHDYLPSVAASGGALVVDVETFAYSSAPQSVQKILDTAGDWTVQESLELRYLTSPAFGQGVGMSIYWEEDLSIPALPPYLGEVVMDGAGAGLVELPPNPVNESVPEEDSFFACGSVVGAPSSWVVMWACGWIALRRRQVPD